MKNPPTSVGGILKINFDVSRREIKRTTNCRWWDSKDVYRSLLGGKLRNHQLPLVEFQHKETAAGCKKRRRAARKGCGLQERAVSCKKRLRAARNDCGLQETT